MCAFVVEREIQGGMRTDGFLIFVENCATIPITKVTREKESGRWLLR